MGELNLRFKILSRLTTSKPLLGSDHNTTIIVEALFPFGHHPEAYPAFDSDTLTELSGLLESYHESPVAPASSRAPSVVPDSSIVSSVAPKSGKASSIARLSSVAPKSGKASSIASSRDDTQLNDQNDQSAQADSNSLHNIQLRYPQWQTVLVRMCILMRVALSRGEYGNPFILTQASGADQKARFIANVFDQSLNELGLTRSKLTTGQ